MKHTIQNKYVSIIVNSFGAELVSIKNKPGVELLWQAKKEIWSRHAPVLFPIVGRLQDNKYVYDKNEFVLSQHGFARDKEFALVEQSDTSLRFELTDNEDSFQVYPFHFSLIISYELIANKIVVRYEVFNPDYQDLLFSIGAHPGFNCCRIPGETMDDYYLEFESTNQLVAEQLKDGLLSGENYTIMLQNNRLPLSVDLFTNDALVLKNNQIESIRLSSKKSDNSIELNCKGWPYFGIWAKKGCAEFVCLEPWFGITDSVNSSGKIEDKEGIIRVNPYSSFEKEFSLEI